MFEQPKRLISAFHDVLGKMKVKFLSLALLFIIRCRFPASKSIPYSFINVAHLGVKNFLLYLLADLSWTTIKTVEIATAVSGPNDVKSIPTTNR